jgi:adenine-specific DNA-methyltransferase
MAPRKKQPAGPTPVEATVHQDKRANIPTADAQEFVAPADEAPITLLYPRDPSLDPQLVWKGKDDTDADDLAVVAPPIFIQEKIDPRVLVENLRQTSRAGEAEPELTLFDSFDGLDGLDIVDFYQHEANWSNRMILGDSLQVMGSLAEREGLRGKLQMIYLDPPYGIKFGSNWQMSTRKRDVKDGKLEDASFEVEQIKAFRDTWELGIHSYLRDRLVVARDLLTESGSCFVQIGDENVHLVRSLMDEVFGSENFVSMVTYAKTTGAGSGAGGTDVLASISDFVIWFARDRQATKYRQLYNVKVAGGEGSGKYNQVETADGTRRPATPAERLGELPLGSRLFRLDNLTSQSGVDKTRFPITLGDRTFTPGGAVWKTGESGMRRVIAARRVQTGRTSLSYVRYLDDFPAFSINNVWTDIGGIQSRSDPKVYVVQTSTSAIERCMLMCTDPGDLVLDPTCGSGTSAYVAEQWGRRWITIDTSRVALALARQRLMGSRFPYYLLADTPEGRAKEASLTGTVPANDSTSGDIRRGFVYERVQHVTLKSIANNPDIVEGMSREEIDAAIKRHADYELLVDKPYEDRKKVRVAGPFTVESLSPHRSLAFAGEVPDVPKTELLAEQDGSAPTFEQMILDNLAKAGIQNGRRNERLSFASVESYPGDYVQAVGERLGESSAADQPASRIGVAIGPQYGTVGPSFIKSAAREAMRAEPSLDLLAVLAFSFDPQALGADADYVTSADGFADVAAERNLGRLPVLLVRMNNDLVMGDDLKKTGSGNLFTVFGEPDIEIRHVPADASAGASGDGADQIEVEILGVDVYDPSTGEVRSRDTDHIALWMVDTNYNEESFFVRHCYFTGGNDPYARLKRALKADIDGDAWASLYSTVSRPFPKPETGKIAIKVINDYGDEVMQVFEVGP